VREVVGRNLQRVEDEGGSLGVDALVQEAANFAQLHLDGVAVFQQGENADSRPRKIVVVVTEAAAAQCARAAADASS
jgi:hypothetical protein